MFVYFDGQVVSACLSALVSILIFHILGLLYCWMTGRCFDYYQGIKCSNVKYPKIHGFLRRQGYCSPDKAIGRSVKSCSRSTVQPTDRTCLQCRWTSPLNVAVCRMTGDLISRWMIARVERQRCCKRRRNSANTFRFTRRHLTHAPVHACLQIFTRKVVRFLARIYPIQPRR